MRFIFVVLLTVAFTLPPLTVAAEERPALAGNVSGELPRGEYVVTSAITVRQGEKFVISAGSALYFEQLAGITVYGELVIDGAPDAAVTLTPADSGAGDTPNAARGIDWNGIETAGPDAVLRLRHARISGSVYGVNVKDLGARVDLAGVIFHNNGYASLMIGGREVPVVPEKPTDVLWDIGPRLASPLLGAERVSSSRSGAGARLKCRTRVGLCAGAIGIAAAGAVVSGVAALNARGDFHKYVWEDDPRRRLELRDRVHASATLGGIGAVITGIGLAGVGLAVFF